MRHHRAGTALLLAATLTVAACAGDTGTGSPSPDARPSATATAPTPTSTSSPVPGGEEDGLPGEPFDLAPAEGDVLAVVGVAAGDVLNVREGPGVQYDVVAELEPTAAEVSATGRGRMLEDGSVWVEVTVGGTTGWAALPYLAYPGRVDDVTSRLQELPTADDLTSLAEQVAQQRVGDTEGTPTVTVVDGPHVGDLGEVTVDVLGVADDSVLGERLRVFARPHGDRFTVRTVEATTLCARGVTDGLCV